MRELLVDAFRTVWRKPLGSTSNEFQAALQMALRMVSIHPCTDFNGRTTRFFGSLASMEANKVIQIAYMSDFVSLIYSHAHRPMRSSKLFLQLEL